MFIPFERDVRKSHTRKHPIGAPADTICFVEGIKQTALFPLTRVN